MSAEATGLLVLLALIITALLIVIGSVIYLAKTEQHSFDMAQAEAEAREILCAANDETNLPRRKISAYPLKPTSHF